MVFLALCFVITFIAIYVLPKFEEVFKDFGTRLPLITELLISASRTVGQMAFAAAVVVVVLLGLWWALHATGRGGGLRDKIGLRLPLVGPVLKRSLLSRWCDAVRLGVHGGMDLPRAMRTAADAVGSPLLTRDVEMLVKRAEAGQPLDQGERPALVPATVLAAVELSARQGVLAEVLATLADMYQQQARAKVGLIPAILTPTLLLLMTATIGFVIVALFAPLVTLIQAVSGGGK
jgi:type IV pilus assembly protein PilC